MPATNLDDVCISAQTFDLAAQVLADLAERGLLCNVTVQDLAAALDDVCQRSQISPVPDAARQFLVRLWNASQPQPVA